MILNHRASPPVRRGFTLIELLTVIAIIVVIMGIAIGALFRVRVSQEEKATETTLMKIQSQFDAQWRTIPDNAKDDAKREREKPGSVPGFALAKAIANSDSRRTLVVWTKILFKLEFPQNFAEVLAWQADMFQVYGLRYKSSYMQTLGGAGVTRQQLPASPTVIQLMQESAVLLYMAVTQARRGVTGFNPTEHVGPHAVGSITLPWYVNASTGQPPSFPVFIDTWGEPIGFIRWPLGGAATDLNQPPQQQLSNGQPVDPQDPEKTLFDNDWIANSKLVDQFTKILEYDPRTMSFPLNLTPVICSSGRDKLWGFDANPLTAFQRLSSDEDDNVYAYRLKGVGRNN